MCIWPVAAEIRWPLDFGCIFLSPGKQDSRHTVLPSANHSERAAGIPLGSGIKGNAVISWTADMDAAVPSAKPSLASTVALSQQSPARELGMVVDISSAHAGG